MEKQKAKIQVEENADILKLTFDEKKAGKQVQAILAILIIFLLILPILGLIFIGFEKGLIAGVLLVYSIAYYFLRIYLWNVYGEEIIIIDHQKITQGFNYGWFVEEEVNVLENKEIKILFNLDKHIELPANFEEVLDMDLMKGETNNNYLIFYQNEENYFQVKTKILKEERENLRKKILEKLN